MARHLIFDAQQDPFEIASDNNRVDYSCNYLGRTEGVTLTFLEEVAQRLEDQGIGTRNTDIFLGPQRTWPKGNAGPFIQLIKTAGVGPNIPYSGNSTNLINRPGLQVIVKGDDPKAVSDKAHEIYNELVGIVNITLSDS